MEPWNESLSEDWVSPSKSSPNPSASTASDPASIQASVRGGKPKSRLPQPKFLHRRSASGAKSASSEPEGSVRVHGVGRNLVLKERTPSGNNVASPQPAISSADEGDDVKKKPATASRGRHISRTISTSTTQTTRYSTVQQKSLSSSPPKDRYRLTPEWRRRLLGSQRGYGEKVDLFGPTGLENIFRPPTQPPSNTPRPSRQHMIPPSQIMPSSPPVFVPGYEAVVSSDPLVEKDDLSSQSLQLQSSHSSANGPCFRETSNPTFSDESDFNQVATSTWRGTRPSRDNIHGLFSRASNLSFDVSKLSTREMDSSKFADSHAELQDEHRLSDDSNASMSPIMISKHNTVDGIGYAALDLAESEALRQASAHILRSRQTSESSRGHTTRSGREISLGDFVTTRRGSYSKDGSFRQRPLSPSSMQASGIGTYGHSQMSGTSRFFPLSRVRRKSASSISTERSISLKAAPLTPLVLPTAECVRPKSSGSPMRLFDADYDTFTRERLYRRLSNIEDSMYPDGSLAFSSTTNDNSPRNIDNYGNPCGDTMLCKRPENMDLHNTPSRASSFGQGSFDKHQFQVDSSYASFLSEDDNEDPKDSRPIPLLTDDMRSVLRSFQVPDFVASRKISKGQQHSKRFGETSKESLQNHRTDEPDLYGSTEISIVKETATIGSKRPSGSPFKIPTPKRRRTIHGNDDRPANLRSDSAQFMHERPLQAQPIIGKRKDASYEGSKNIADPQVVAMRQILKPRNRLSGQAIGSRKDVQDDGSENQVAVQSKLNVQLNMATKQMASLGINKEMITDSRKGSVTTQDYLDEATRVMELIRARNRPRSGLTSGEQSETEADSAIVGASDAKQFEAIPEDNESTRDEFSRPPSRNGARSLPSKDQIQLDPRVILHLDKYKENGTIGLISSSMEFMAVGQDQTRADGVNVESQPPNMRILPSNSNVSKDNPSINSTSSTGSSGPATSRSIQTGSSGRSDTRRNIAPHTVSHLIPGQVAGMIYDGAQQTWVKAEDAFSGSDCEDDPFGGISDLSVNEMQELARVKKASMDETARNQKTFPAAAQGTVQGLQYGISLDKSQPNLADDARPVTRDGPVQSLVDSSSVPSKMSKFASSGPQPETRATSWGDTVPRDTWKQGPSQTTAAALLPADQTAQIDMVENSTQSELGVGENLKDSVVQNPVHENGDSSPLTSRSYDHDLDHPRSLGHDIDGKNCQIEEADSSFDHGPSLDRSFMNDLGQSRRFSFGLTPNSKTRGIARRVSFGGQSFPARPISRIDEQSEESSARVAEEHRGAGSAGFQVTFSTPLRIRDIPGTLSVPVSTVARRSQLSFHLSPLPDFTINQIDESFNRDIRHVAERRGVLCLRDIDSTFGLATEQLIKNVTDVEPYEPYWDWIRHIELKGKGLLTLHDLDQFCSRIERLDVSNNELGQLNGAPTSLRDLNISRNCLSNLTTWAHLINLQFLDVSGNQLECLDGFAGLVHLRELRVDDNKLASLSGVFDLDGLMVLKARRNCLQSIDFEESSLARLNELDLRGNRLESVRGLSSLEALEHLNLEDNKLEEFCASSSETLPVLCSLKLSDNQLKNLNVSHIPNLRVLYVDRNKLFTVDGLRRTTHLDSFSIREQDREMEPPDMTSDRFEDCFEVRKVYGSGNAIPQFSPQTTFLNLQYLELASCGIQQLPAEFGSMMPNVRVLNLNFNAITDIRPLSGIVRLKKLFLAGNRLGRLRKLLNTLVKFPVLSRLDMRNNPLTLGFYPPINETRMVLLDPLGAPEELFQEPYTLPVVDPARDASYRSRLDLDTKLRIRVYEMLLASGCPSVKVLDGLIVQPDGVVIKDDVWEALLKMGIVKDIQTSPKELICLEKANVGKSSGVLDERASEHHLLHNGVAEVVQVEEVNHTEAMTTEVV